MALNHRYPQRRSLSDTNGLHDYQRPPATQTMTSRLRGPPVPRASAAAPQTSLQTTHAAPPFGSVAVAVLTAPTTASVSCAGYDHTDDHDEPRAVPVRPTSGARFSTGPKAPAEHGKRHADDACRCVGVSISRHQKVDPPDQSSVLGKSLAGSFPTVTGQRASTPYLQVRAICPSPSTILNHAGRVRDVLRHLTVAGAERRIRFCHNATADADPPRGGPRQHCLSR